MKETVVSDESEYIKDDAVSCELVATEDSAGQVCEASNQAGMATAEYAVGILAAVALALVLMKVFSADSFFSAAVKLVTTIVSKVLGMF